MSCPFDLFLIFILIFTMINLMNTDTECALLLLDDNGDEKCE